MARTTSDIDIITTICQSITENRGVQHRIHINRMRSARGLLPTSKLCYGARFGGVQFLHPDVLCWFIIYWELSWEINEVRTCKNRCYHRNRAIIIASLCGSVQWVRTSSVMRLVMSSSPDRSEYCLIFHLWLVLSDYIGMAKWSGAHYNQDVRFSSGVKCKGRTPTVDSTQPLCQKIHNLSNLPLYAFRSL